jgi:hypothetical protein
MIGCQENLGKATSQHLSSTAHQLLPVALILVRSHCRIPSLAAGVVSSLKTSSHVWFSVSAAFFFKFMAWTSSCCKAELLDSVRAWFGD